MDKKQVKFQYKNSVPAAGIFQIKNNLNGKVLVGGSLNLEGRRNRFNFEQQTGSVSNNPKLQRDWTECGPENFSFEVLEQLKLSDDLKHNYRDELAALEEKWLEKLQPYGDHGYNPPPKDK